MENKLDKFKLKIGDRLSRISYMEVTKIDLAGMEVVNEEGYSWRIAGDILAKECYSANQFNEEKEVTRTELIEIFSKVGDAVFTVNFNKLPTADDFLALTRDSGNKIRSFNDMQKDFKKLKGEERTLVGYLITTENGFGRSNVVDLMIRKEEGKELYNTRQVDHRTLNWLICKNVKYKVKK